MIGIIRGYGIVLRAQAEKYEWLKELFDPKDIYIFSEEKLRDERTVSIDNLKYIGNMHPIQTIALDKDNIGRFLREDMKKFDIIMEQGEHFPLSLLINKYAKQHGVLTLDVHQGSDYFDDYFNVPLSRKVLGCVIFFLRLRFRGFRHLLYVLLKYDSKLLMFIMKNISFAGFRFYRSLPEEYRFDKCFVYGNKIKRIYKLMDYKDDDIVILGDHDLTKYERYYGEKYSSEKPYIIYVDSQVISTFSFLNEFNEFAKLVINDGYDFFFYPHPNQNEDFISSLDKDIKVLPKKSIEKYLENAHFIFMHNSNMVHLMVYAGKRFCFLYGPKMAGKTYLKFQSKTAERLGVPNVDVTKKEHVLRLLNDFHFDEKKYQTFLDEECGNLELHQKGSDNILIETVGEMLRRKR